MLHFSLSVELVNVILNALNEAPYRVAAPVIAEIQRQAQEQMNAPPPLQPPSPQDGDAG